MNHLRKIQFDLLRSLVAKNSIQSVESLLIALDDISDLGAIGLEYNVESIAMISVLLRRGAILPSFLLYIEVVTRFPLKESVDFLLNQPAVWTHTIATLCKDRGFTAMVYSLENTGSFFQHGFMSTNMTRMLTLKSLTINEEELSLISSIHPDMTMPPWQFARDIACDDIVLHHLGSHIHCPETDMESFLNTSTSRHYLSPIAMYYKTRKMSQKSAVNVIRCGTVGLIPTLCAQYTDEEIASMFHQDVAEPMRPFLSNCGYRVNAWLEDPYSVEAENTVCILAGRRYSSLHWEKKLKIGLRSLVDQCADVIRREWYRGRTLTWEGHVVTYDEPSGKLFTYNMGNDNQLIPDELNERLHLSDCTQHPLLK